MGTSMENDMQIREIRPEDKFMDKLYAKYPLMKQL